MPAAKTYGGSASCLKRLRDMMRSNSHVTDHLQAYIIPSEDAHQSEYIAECDTRRRFISGFTGSRGLAIVTFRSAALWTDGRYFLQAERELGPDWTLMREGDTGVPTPTQWLLDELDMGGRVGFDPYLVSMSWHNELKHSLEDQGGLALTPVFDNLVDVVWGNERPAPPRKPIIGLPLRYAGVTPADKLKTVRDTMTKEGAAVLVLSALDEIAWLFNLRGSDIEYNPVFFAYAIIGLDFAYLFTEADRIEAAAKKQQLQGVRIFGYSQVNEQLDLLRRTILPKARGSTAHDEGGTDSPPSKFWLPCESTSFALSSIVPKKYRVEKMSPIQMLKARKNDVELSGMRYAHVRDAVAHCEFLQWLEQEMRHASRKSVDDPPSELSVATKFEELRKQQEDFVGLSFATISAAGANAANPHYSTCPETDALLAHNQIYLVDSGGQYRDGTTDVTRTLAFADATQYQKECYTRVLKSHIALASITFPEHTEGYRLDCIARVPLWEAAKDYRHGTGHGVGHFLNVHEGPAGFHFRRRLAEGLIEAGMCLTIEPGYYEAGAFGIRIENVYAVVPRLDGPSGGSPKFLSFDPLTLVPIAKDLLEPSLLTPNEIAWLNEYHRKVEEVVGEELRKQGKEDVLQWLLQQTTPVG